MFLGLGKLRKTHPASGVGDPSKEDLGPQSERVKLLLSSQRLILLTSGMLRKTNPTSETDFLMPSNAKQIQKHQISAEIGQGLPSRHCLLFFVLLVFADKLRKTYPASRVNDPIEIYDKPSNTKPIQKQQTKASVEVGQGEFRVL